MTKYTKRWLLCTLLVFALAASFALAACAQQATATFEGGEGSTGTAPTAITGTVGGKITLPANTFTRDGYTFAGWSDGTTTYAAGAEYTLAADVTFTAQWTDNTPTPSTPTEPFTDGPFYGFITLKSASEHIDILFMPNGFCALYPSADLGLGEDEDIEMDGAAYTVADGKITVELNETLALQLTIDGINLSGSVTLGGNAYSIDADVYTLTIVGASGDMPASLFVSVGSNPIALMQGDDESTTVKIDGTALTQEQKGTWAMPSKDCSIEIIPAEEPTRYTLSFDLGAHAAENAACPESVDLAKDETHTLPEAPAAAEGWAFDGWGDDKLAAGSTFTMQDSSVTLTAQWKEAPFTTQAFNGRVAHNSTTSTGKNIFGVLEFYANGTGTLSLKNTDTGFAIIDSTQFNYTVSADGKFTITEFITEEEGAIKVTTPVSGTIEGRKVSITISNKSAAGTTTDYKFESLLYKLTLAKVDGTSNVDQYLYEGAEYNLTNQQYADHNLVKFIVDGNDKDLAWGSSFAMPASDTAVEYIWDEIHRSTFTVTYKPGEGATGSEYTDTVTADEYKFLFHSNENLAYKYEGHYFKGWKIEGDESGKLYQGNDVYTTPGTITVVGQWDKYITVTYANVENADTNLGTLQKNIENYLTSYTPSSNFYLPYGQSQSSGALYFSKGGFTLKGWTSSDDEGTEKQGTVYAPGSKYTLSKDVTFTAVWETAITSDRFAEYFGMYIADEEFAIQSGETVEKINLTANAIEIYIEGNDEPKLGEDIIYNEDSITFKLGSVDVTMTFQNDKMTLQYKQLLSNKTVTLTKQGTTQDKFDVTYALGDHAADNAQLPETKQYAQGEQVTVADAIAAADGWEFAGWSDGTHTYKPGDHFDMPAEAVTLTATYNEHKEIVPTTKTLADYQGYYKGSVNGWDAAQIDGSTIKFRSEGYLFAAGTTDFTLTEDKTGEFLVANGNRTFTGKTTEIILTFVTDGSFSITVNVTTNNPLTGSSTKSYTATFTAAEAVTVTFDLGDEYTGSTTDYDEQTLLSGEKPTSVRQPAQEGYTFDGWYVGDSDVEFSFEQPVTQSTTVKAKWTKLTTVKITYIENGQNVTGMPVNQEIEAGSILNQPSPDPVREGYKFLGWYTSSWDTTKKYTFGKAVESDLTLYAMWGKTLTVKFGEPAAAHTGEAPESIETAGGETITLPECPYVVEGKIFIGWKSSMTMSSSSQLYAAKSTFTIGSGVQADITFSPIFGKEYTEKTLGKVTVRDDMWVQLDGEWILFESSGTDNVIVNYDYGMAIELSDDGSCYLLDGMQTMSFTANDKTTKLTFDGKGNATLGAHQGTYTLKLDDDGYYVIGFNLNIGDKDYDIVIGGSYDEYVIDVVITIGDVEYIFGNPTVKVTIKYEQQDGEEGTVPEAQIVDCPYKGEKEVTLATPTQLSKEGNVFAGWKLKSGDDEQVYTKYTVHSDDTEIVFVATWKEASEGGFTPYTKLSDFAGASAKEPVTYGYSFEEAIDKLIAGSSSNSSRVINKIDFYWEGEFKVAYYYDASGTEKPLVASLKVDGSPITEQTADNQIGYLAIYGGDVTVQFSQNVQGQRQVTLSCAKTNSTVTWLAIGDEPLTGGAGGGAGGGDEGGDVSKDINDYLGIWTGSIDAPTSDTYDSIRIAATKAEFHDEWYKDTNYETGWTGADFEMDSSGENLVITFKISNLTCKITFTSATTLTLEMSNVQGNSVTAEFTKEA